MMDQLVSYLPHIDRELLPTTIASISAALFVVFYAYKKTAAKDDEVPKGLKSVPVAPGRQFFFGHLLKMGKRPVIQLQKWHESIEGPFFRVDFGERKIIMINDPQVAHEIFVQRGAFTSSRASHTYSHNIYGVGGRGVVIAKSGKKWKNSRTLALDILAPKFVDHFDLDIAKETEYAAKILMDATAEKGSINPLKTLQLATMNVITVTSFGERFLTTDDPMFRTLVDLAERTLIYSGIMGDTGAFFPKLGWIDIVSGRRRKLRTFVKEYRDKPLAILIDKARNGTRDCLVKTIDTVKDKYEMDELDITLLLSDMIVAGSDTTAVSLTWAFAILVRYPEIQKKIQQEIDAFVEEKGVLPRYADRDHFSYMISVQKECMRYRTTTNFGVPHVSTEAFEYKGYYIPEDSTIISSMYSMHRNPSVYTKPNDFIPERFMSNTRSMYAAANGPLENRDHYNFGWGRRLCPGTHLAEVEMFNAFVSVFSKCTIEPTLNAQGESEYPNIDDVKVGGVVVTPVEHQVRFVPRK